MDQFPRIFISHSHKDTSVAKALVDLIKEFLEIKVSDIRCTSVAPYCLSPGTRTSDTLRSEIKASEIVLGLISPKSLESKYVLAELGAAWGCDITTFPLLIRGARHSDLPPPLYDLTGLDITTTTSCISCVENIGRFTSLKRIRQDEDLSSLHEAAMELARRANASY